MTQAIKLGYFLTSNFVLLLTDWVKTGLEFFSNCCNAFVESRLRGLKILVSGVQISVLAYPQASLYAGFSIFYPFWAQAHKPLVI